MKHKSLRERARIFSSNTTNVNSMIHRNYVMCTSDTTPDGRESGWGFANAIKIANILSEGDSMKNIDWQYFIMLMCVYPLLYMKRAPKELTKLENGNIWSKLSYQKSRSKLLCKCNNILAQKNIPTGDLDYISHLRSCGYLEKILPKNTLKVFHELCK